MWSPLSSRWSPLCFRSRASVFHSWPVLGLRGKYIVGSFCSQQIRRIRYRQENQLSFSRTNGPANGTNGIMFPRSVCRELPRACTKHKYALILQKKDKGVERKRESSGSQTKKIFTVFLGSWAIRIASITAHAAPRTKNAICSPRIRACHQGMTRTIFVPEEMPFMAALEFATT